MVHCHQYLNLFYNRSSSGHIPLCFLQFLITGIAAVKYFSHDLASEGGCLILEHLKILSNIITSEQLSSLNLDLGAKPL